MSRLVVVSNRVVVPDSGDTQAGGLAVALQEALEEAGGIWFGWNGKVDGQRGGRVETTEIGNVCYATMGLSRKDYNEYYNGFANRVLWPLFHYRADLTMFSHDNYAGYLRTNALFANKLRPLLKPDDLIWVHDYHLIPIGAELRNAGVDRPLGFFLHTPWPAMEVMLTLPTHDRLVRSLCAYDLVGFQTYRDLRAFLDYIELEAKGRVWPDGTVEAYGRELRAKHFPIGLDTEEVSRAAAENANSGTVRRLKRSLGDRQLIIGVDRLDYSKGIGQRLNAFETLLAQYPDNRNRVVMIQVAPASRAEVPEYRQIRSELEQQAGHINGRFSELDWNPVRFIGKAFRRPQLTGIYRAAGVGLVTPLRDGMNLVAKEYVAAQDPEDPGVLVLSRFAGAAEQLSSAVMVNPFDVEGMAEAIQRALVMPLEERKARWREMYDVIAAEDIGKWRRDFIRELEAAGYPGELMSGAAPFLVADIGGTNARFALAGPDGNYGSVLRLHCADFAGPAEAIRTFLAERRPEAPPRAAALAIASPLTGDIVSMTNHPWTFSVAGLRDALGIDRLDVVNDFAAVAHAMPHLRAGNWIAIGDGEAVEGNPIGVLGPGTGLGVSGLVPRAGRAVGWSVLASEGGHVTMAPADDREAEVLAVLRRRMEHLSAERVVSGPGLANLYDALCEIAGQPPEPLDPAEISGRAVAGSDPICVEALAMMFAMLGTVAGNLALTLGARGGVYLAGGILPRLREPLLASAFRERFCAKGRFRSWLERVPTRLVVHSEPALLGLARLLAQDDAAVEKPDLP